MTSMGRQSGGSTPRLASWQWDSSRPLFAQIHPSVQWCVVPFHVPPLRARVPIVFPSGLLYTLVASRFSIACKHTATNLVSRPILDLYRISSLVHGASVLYPEKQAQGNTRISHARHKGTSPRRADARRCSAYARKCSNDIKCTYCGGSTGQNINTQGGN